MDFELGVEYILTAIENVKEEKIYTRWVNGYQNMAYEEFKKSLGYTKETNDTRTEEEILGNVRNILKNK